MMPMWSGLAPSLSSFGMIYSVFAASFPIQGGTASPGNLLWALGHLKHLVGGHWKSTPFFIRSAAVDAFLKGDLFREWPPMKVSCLAPRTRANIPSSSVAWVLASIKMGLVAHTHSHFCAHKQLILCGEFLGQVWLLFCQQQLPCLLQLMKLLELGMLSMFLIWLCRNNVQSNMTLGPVWWHFLLADP